MSLAIRYEFETLRSLAFGSIVAGYIGVGTKIEHPCKQFLIQNLTDALLTFSFDGVNDHFVLPVSGFFLSDVSSNRGNMQEFALAKGDRLYVKRNGVPTSGSVYFSVMYGSLD